MDRVEIIVQGSPKWDQLAAKWKREGKPRRFTLTNGEVYSASVTDGDVPKFEKIDPSGLYGSVSVTKG